ncbi:hypothetical protein [Thiorhodococcus minor]|uniref:Uncharacterized protein n=1 Tax=Thiorhodococcus minor TaxID=57489 RepID=A0A6M0K2U8_9GAMM|nr:hypothetical protein [Thiorhodococcus minor]NEV62645.1 hypothetical protein [Thiorhodococcus minor]
MHRMDTHGGGHAVEDRRQVGNLVLPARHLSGSIGKDHEPFEHQAVDESGRQQLHGERRGDE